MTRNLFGDFLMRRLLTDFRRCDLSGRCRYPLRLENVPQISQIYTDFSWDVFFVTQISQMTQIFLRGRVLSHRFHRYTQIFYGISGESLCPISGGIFSSWDYFCPTDFTDIHRFFMESLVNLFVQSQGVSATTGQVASAKIRE